MIIGLVGEACAGTDTLGKLLVEEGFIWLSYSDILREQLQKEGLEITRVALQNLANEIRERYGAGELSRRLLEKMQDGKNYVVGTMRNPAEIEVFRSMQDFVLLHVNASPEIRFNRMLERARENDPRSWEDFLAFEKKESGFGQTASGLRVSDCIKLADYKIVNERSIEELKENVELLLKQLKLIK